MTETLYKPLTWDDLVNDPTLQNLPYKIELRDGKVVMSPAGKTRGRLQFAIGKELDQRGGVTLTETAVRTREGVYVADVVRVSDARWAQYADDGPLPIAPETGVPRGRCGRGLDRAARWNQGDRSLTRSVEHSALARFTPAA